MLSRAAGLRRRFTGKWRVGCASSRHTEADKRVGHVLDLLTEHCVEWDGFFQLDKCCRGVQKKLRGESGLEENIPLITESQDSEAKVSVIWFNHHDIILAHFVQ